MNIVPNIPCDIESNPKCGDCSLSDTCNSPYMPTVLEFAPYKPKACILFIGQNPGWEEDVKSEGFVGKPAQILREAYIRGLELDERATIYFSYGVRCHTINNETPKPAHYASCISYTHTDLNILLPQAQKRQEMMIIITLGAAATVSFHKNILGQKKMSLNTSFSLNGNIGEWGGIKFNYFSTYHPAAIIREKNLINAVSSHMQLVSDCIEGTMASPSDPLIVPTRSPL